MQVVHRRALFAGSGMLATGCLSCCGPSGHRLLSGALRGLQQQSSGKAAGLGQQQLLQQHMAVTTAQPRMLQPALLHVRAAVQARRRAGPARGCNSPQPWMPKPCLTTCSQRLTAHGRSSSRSMRSRCRPCGRTLCGRCGRRRAVQQQLLHL